MKVVRNVPIFKGATMYLQIIHARIDALAIMSLVIYSVL